MYGYIYLTTNTINGKIYIGQHKSEKFVSYYKGSGTLIKRAFKVYGKSNFIVEQLDTAESAEELNDKEIFYIKKYNATSEDVGYNLSAGGSGWCNYPEDVDKRRFKRVPMYKGDEEVRPLLEDVPWFEAHGYVRGRSERSRKSLSEGYNYSSKGMLGKKQSDKQKAAVSKACSYKRSEEQRKHFSDAKKDQNKFVCMRTPENKSTIRVLVQNVDKYLAQGYKLCNT